MVLLLNPLLAGLDAARDAVGDAIDADDDVTVEDQGDHWVFEFVPRADVMGGGARVSVAKGDFRILSLVRGQ